MGLVQNLDAPMQQLISVRFSMRLGSTFDDAQTLMEHIASQCGRAEDIPPHLVQTHRFFSRRDWPKLFRSKLDAFAEPALMWCEAERDFFVQSSFETSEPLIDDFLDWLSQHAIWVVGFERKRGKPPVLIRFGAPPQEILAPILLQLERAGVHY